MARELRFTLFCSIALMLGTEAFAGPTQYSVATSQFPIGFYVPDASSNSAPFSGPYYVAVAAYADGQDDALAFTHLTNSISYFDPTGNSLGTYSATSDANTTLAFGTLPFTTDLFGSNSPLPDGSTPSTWGGTDLGVALQFFAPQREPGCFAYQTGCQANAAAQYMTAAPLVYQPDATNNPDTYGIKTQIPGGSLTFQFELVGVDPNSVGFSYTNDNTVNNNTVVILAGSILNNASTVQVIWGSTLFQSNTPPPGSGGGDPVMPVNEQVPGTPVVKTVDPPGFIQASDQQPDVVPEPSTLLLVASGLLWAGRKFRKPQASVLN